MKQGIAHTTIQYHIPTLSARPITPINPLYTSDVKRHQITCTLHDQCLEAPRRPNTDRHSPPLPWTLKADWPFLTIAIGSEAIKGVENMDAWSWQGALPFLMIGRKLIKGAENRGLKLTGGFLFSEDCLVARLSNGQMLVLGGPHLTDNLVVKLSKGWKTVMLEADSHWSTRFRECRCLLEAESSMKRLGEYRWWTVRTVSTIEAENIDDRSWSRQFKQYRCLRLRI